MNSPLTHTDTHTNFSTLLVMATYKKKEKGEEGREARCYMAIMKIYIQYKRSGLRKSHHRSVPEIIIRLVC